MYVHDFSALYAQFLHITPFQISVAGYYYAALTATSILKYLKLSMLLLSQYSFELQAQRCSKSHKVLCSVIFHGTYRGPPKIRTSPFSGGLCLGTGTYTGRAGGGRHPCNPTNIVQITILLELLPCYSKLRVQMFASKYRFDLT